MQRRVLAPVSNFGLNKHREPPLHEVQKWSLLNRNLQKNRRSSGCKYVCTSLMRAKQSSERCLRAGFTVENVMWSNTPLQGASDRSTACSVAHLEIMTRLPRSRSQGSSNLHISSIHSVYTNKCVEIRK